jgi:hypothetical protein
VKKGKTWASDLDTSVEFMTFLAEHGLVRQDGTMKTGKPGRPPVAWVPIEDAIDWKNLPEMEQPQTRAREETSQENIDKVIVEVSNSSYAIGCECIVKLGTGTTKDEIMAHKGCKDRWICGALDAVRRRADLFAKEQPFQEVV